VLYVQISDWCLFFSETCFAFLEKQRLLKNAGNCHK
jgi:hypothetical protein